MLSEDNEEAIQDIIDSGVLSHIIELINHKEVNIQLPSLRIIGNMSAGSDLQTETIVNSQAPLKLYKELDSVKLAVRKDAIWCFSNMCVGHERQINTLFELNIFPKIISILQRDVFCVQEEAL